MISWTANQILLWGPTCQEHCLQAKTDTRSGESKVPGESIPYHDLVKDVPSNCLLIGGMTFPSVFCGQLYSLSALLSLQDIYTRRCWSRAAQIPTLVMNCFNELWQLPKARGQL